MAATVLVAGKRKEGVKRSKFYVERSPLLFITLNLPKMKVSLVEFLWRTNLITSREDCGVEGDT